MLWILQKNFFSESGYIRLVETLERLSLPIRYVTVVPFTKRLIPMEVDASTAVDVDNTTEIDVGDEPIITMGSYTLAQIANDRGWAPGAFTANLDYSSWAEGWGHHNLLNPNAKIVRFADASFEETTFVRPVLDSKSFSGKVFEHAEFQDWKEQVLKSSQHDDPLNADTEVILSKPVKIFTETRCWVVNGKVVTMSQYRRGGKVQYVEGADEEVYQFACERIAEWTPNVAFVLDIAQTPDGCKVIEVNCLNAAGFYACDTFKLVEALESLR
jgi:hypothetical protein